MGYNDPPQNPYDDKTKVFDNPTLPLDQVIKIAILAETLRLRVMMPAMVVKKNGTSSVNVQPLFKTRTITGKVTNLPEIQMVPVSMVQGADYVIKPPVAVGDTGYITFADRNLTNWLAGAGGAADPEDSRQHHLSDAVFVPALVPTGKAFSDDTTDMVLMNGGATIRILKSGKFKIMNGSAELVDQVSQLAEKTKELAEKTAEMALDLSTETVTVVTLGVPTPLNGAAQYAILNTELQQIATDLGNIISSINTLKG